jgi:hypothetical protein|tara:strand:+ start:595 stop:750 length:156 start_codon:yes stop_codon:yes gene_type:complete
MLHSYTKYDVQTMMGSAKPRQKPEIMARKSGNAQIRQNEINSARTPLLSSL